MPVPGFDTFIVDEPLSGTDAQTTDRLFLLGSAGPAEPTVARRADTADDTLNAWLRGYFNDGGRSVILQGFDAAAGGLPDLAAALALLPAGPGQVVAPEAVTSPDLIAIAGGAWSRGKVALLQGPSTATDADLATLAGAVIAGTDGRGAALFADYASHAPLAGSTPDVIPWTVTVAALIARNDRLYHNPNIAAAGKRGVSNDALGLEAARTDAAIETLKDAQVNAAKVVGAQVRNYGYRTLADLDALPHWWDLSGSRTVMAYRAQAAAIDEDFVFEQVDGRGEMLERYKGRLQSAAKDLYDAGALFGATPEEAYRVDVGPSVNPLEDIAAGEIEAQVYLKTSPFAEHLVTNITRRAITAAI